MHVDRVSRFVMGAFDRSLAGEQSRPLFPESLIVRLFDELRLPLHRYLVCLGTSAAEAEELTQETFLRLHRHLEAGKPADNARSWLYRVAHNLAVDGRRDKGRAEQLSDDAWTALLQSQHDPALGPEELLLERERVARFHAAFRMLTEVEQHCVHLRAEGFRYREIAEIVQAPLSTVSDTLRRAIDKLARACETSRA